jgi:hypothetical protein
MAGRRRSPDVCIFARGMLPALSIAAAESGRLPRELFDLAEIVRR